MMRSGRYFVRIETLEDLKKQYKKLALENHPDRGGDVEIMKEINAEYDRFFADMKNYHRNAKGEVYTKENNEAPEEFRDIIEKLIKMDGLEIEIIGCFIYWTSNSIFIFKFIYQVCYFYHRPVELYIDSFFHHSS